MDERKRLYLAYGSNINLTQMKYRCPAAVPLMPVELKNYTLAFRGGGVATILPEKDSFVPCLLWSITPACEQSLDRYEGYPNLYHKEMVTITIPMTTSPLWSWHMLWTRRIRSPVCRLTFIIGESWRDTNKTAWIRNRWKRR